MPPAVPIIAAAAIAGGGAALTVGTATAIIFAVASPRVLETVVDGKTT